MPRSRSAHLVSRSARFSLLFILAGSSFFILPLAAKRPKDASPAPDEDLGMKNIPLTVGHEAKGLILPNYDLKGNLLGRFEAAVASRVDEDHVRFKNLKMTTFDAGQKADLYIDMTDAVLNLQTRVLTSEERTKIKRADFEIAGDAMQFSTLTRQGALTGNVHMTLFNQSELAAKTKK